jgi:quercetin dioxygenase-like cupin family protein
MFFTHNLDQLTEDNEDYRREIYTTPTSQLVVMSVPAGDTVPRETHPYTTQFTKVVSGWGELEMGGEVHFLQEGSVAIIPPNTEHFIYSLPASLLRAKYNPQNQFRQKPLKLYIVYSPPEHPEGTREPSHSQQRNSPAYYRTESPPSASNGPLW